MFVCCEYFVLSGRSLCDKMITRPEESYRLWCERRGPGSLGAVAPNQTDGCCTSLHYRYGMHSETHVNGQPSTVDAARSSYQWPISIQLNGDFIVCKLKQQHVSTSVRHHHRLWTVWRQPPEAAPCSGVPKMGAIFWTADRIFKFPKKDRFTVSTGRTFNTSQQLTRPHIFVEHATSK